MSSERTPKIRVLVRKRPINKKQLQKGETDIIDVQGHQTVIVKEQKYKVDLTPFIDVYKFNFDGVYDHHATNEQIYLTSVRPLVDCAFDGARVSCFAYGQTGSGKTYTMLGDGAQVRGLYLLAAADIFQQIQNHEQFSIWISFYEIYCGKLYDLLNDRNVLFAREDAKGGVNIVGLSERKICGVDNLMHIIQYGTGVRVTAQNGTNVDSSRSHAILQIVLKNSNKIHGKISFIDLAGSQRAADHADQLEKQTRIDGAEINKSLLALKECIRALDQNKNHTPFRGSKLTMVLKDSFTGYCRTVMIGNISPNSLSCQNTLNTLKYADRVKELKKPNKDQQIMQLNNLDQMSKELMLPRHNVNITQKKRPSEEPLFNNPNQYQPPQQQLFTKPSRHSYNPPTQKYTNNYTASNSKEPYQNNYPHPFPTKNLVQQQEPETLDYESLAKKHENYIQIIIEQEEQLMKTHEKHINTTIQLMKQEMMLMGEADKIGSDVEQYLNSLEIVLERQLSSIKEVKDRVLKLKRNLKESQRIEKLYIEESNKVLHYNEPDACLLDDDQHLFK